MTFTRPTAQAQLPDLSILRDLTPGVAYATLGAVVIVTVLFYVGPALRSRLGHTPAAPAKDPPPTPVAPAVSALPDALDRADASYDRFIDHLLRQDTRNAERIEELERELAVERGEVARLSRLLWQERR